MIRKLMTTLAALSVAYVATARAETPLERGAYLVNGIAACGNCHTPKGPHGPIAAMAFAGGFVVEDGPFRAVSANITQDRETGIGGWTDLQIMDAIRNGRRPDGTIIGPPMPIELYHMMSDSDVRAIVAYLRTIKPIRHKVEKSVYHIKLHAPPPVMHVSEPDRANKVAYGEYLAGPLGHCIECHTPMGPKGRDFAHRLGGGGFVMSAPGGGKIMTPNITPDPVDGIGKWSDADIKRAFTMGIRPDGSHLVPIMAFAQYRTISAADQDAIVAFLRSLKPLKGN